MAFIDRLKGTGESYEQFLNRLRSQEVKAKKCLPENKKYYKSWQKQAEESQMIDEFETYEDWGWMNSWTQEKEDEIKCLREAGYKFDYLRTSRGYTIGFNRELSIFFRIDSSG